MLGGGAEDAASLWGALSGAARRELERELGAVEVTAGSATAASLCAAPAAPARAGEGAAVPGRPSWVKWVGDLRDSGWREARSALFAALDAACAAVGESLPPAPGERPSRGGSVGAQVALWWARRYGVEHEMRRRLMSALRALVAQRARGCYGAAWIERVLGLDRGHDAAGALFAHLWPRLRARCGRAVALGEGDGHEQRGSSSSAAGEALGPSEGQEVQDDTVLQVITASQAAAGVRDMLLALHCGPEPADEVLIALQRAPLQPAELRAATSPTLTRRGSLQEAGSGDEPAGAAALPPSGSHDHLALGSGGASVVRALRALAAGSLPASAALVPLEQALHVGMAAVLRANSSGGRQRPARSRSASELRRRQLRRGTPSLSQLPVEPGTGRGAGKRGGAGASGGPPGAAEHRPTPSGGRSAHSSASEAGLRSAAARVPVADLLRASEEEDRPGDSGRLGPDLLARGGTPSSAAPDSAPGPTSHAPGAPGDVAPVPVTVSELISARRRLGEGTEQGNGGTVSPVDARAEHGPDSRPWAHALRRGGGAECGAGPELSHMHHIPIVREEPRATSNDIGTEPQSDRSSPDPGTRRRGLRVVKAERRRVVSGLSASGGEGTGAAAEGGSWLRPNSPVVTPSVRMPPSRRGTPATAHKPPTGRSVRPGEGGRLPKPIRAPVLGSLAATEGREGGSAPTSGLRGTLSLGALPEVADPEDDFNFV